MFGIHCVRRVLGVAVVFGVLVPATAPCHEPTPDEIDVVTMRAMEAFQIPGVAIGVVKDGELIYARGHGVREIGKPEPVDADTIFQIASLTKAFTAASLGILVDEGKLDWDDPVIDYLPEFRMHDPWVTREFTIRDLLTHRSGLGLGAGDLLFWPEARSTIGDVIRAMRFLKPETSFRTAYAYDNLLYAIAGEVVTRVSGVAWEDFVEKRIFEPLGMTECRAAPDRVQGHPNRATPHMVVDGELQTTFFSSRGATAAAGGINCSVNGLAKWAAMHLSGGELSGEKRLLSGETHRELWTPVTLIPVRGWAREHGRTHFSTYGLGWRLSDFHGHLLVSHGGALQGMTSAFGILPEKGVAVIVLNNQWSAAPRAVALGILNAYVSKNPEDWVAVFSKREAEGAGKAKQEVEEALANRNAESTPSLPIEFYAGTYRDSWYGDVFVEQAADGLVMRFSRSDLLTGPLEHFQYDTFIARWLDRSLYADAYVTFILDAEGGVEAIRMKWVSPDTDFSFDYHHLDLRRVEKD
jgi:CubicO group peptidase (beta-lactamase class C family)